MPIPKPNKNEKKDEFVSRCMGDEVMKKEYSDQSQRAAICYSSWKEKMKAQSVITGNMISYSIRYEEIDGINYIVVPVTMSKPGVHYGSEGPALYTEELLSFLPEQWNGRPVVLFYTEAEKVNHPQDSEGNLLSANSPSITKQANVGIIYNSKYEDGLKAEAYINVDKLKSVSDQAYASIASGQMIEVSIGSYEIRDDVSGEWNGEKYDAIVTELISDHLALLPGGEGACSIKDGCGIQANKGKEGIDTNEEEKKKSFLEKMKQKLNGFFGDAKGKQSDIEIRDLLNLALQSVSPKIDCYIREVFPDYFVYERQIFSLTGEATWKFFKREYSFDGGKIVLGDTVEEVYKKTDYIPVSNIGIHSNEVVPLVTYEEKGDSMDKKKIIDFLIGNSEKTGFSEENREYLNGLSDCHLGKLHSLAEKIVNAGLKEVSKVETQPITQVNSGPQPDPIPATQPDPVPVAQANFGKKQLTTDEFLNTLPVEVANSMRSMMILAANQKAMLVDLAVKANPAFTKEELGGLSETILQKMITSPSGFSFAGNAGGPVPDLSGNSNLVPAPKLWENIS